MLSGAMPLMMVHLTESEGKTSRDMVNIALHSYGDGGGGGGLSQSLIF